MVILMFLFVGFLKDVYGASCFPRPVGVGPYTPDCVYQESGTIGCEDFWTDIRSPRTVCDPGGGMPGDFYETEVFRCRCDWRTAIYDCSSRGRVVVPTSLMNVSAGLWSSDGGCESRLPVATAPNPPFSKNVAMYEDDCRGYCQSVASMGSPPTSIPSPMTTFVPGVPTPTPEDQKAWFQVTSGGVAAGLEIINSIPETCADDKSRGCIPALTISDLGGDNGLVAASDITNDGNCGSECKYGFPNDWGVKSSIIGERYDYQYFLDNYYYKYSVGQIFRGSNLSFKYDIWPYSEGEKIVYVQGNLVIDMDITEEMVPEPGFFMVVVSGKISVDSSVKEINGVYVADLGFEADGLSPDQLVIKGVLYSPGGDIRLVRGYSDKIMNNTSPAVVVRYRPDLMFNMPAVLASSVSKWREGR